MAKLTQESMSNGMAEADHRIANHLTMLSSYVRLKGRRLAQRGATLEPEDVRSLISMIVAQIDAISDLHRILSTQGNAATSELSTPLSRICAAMQAGVSGEVVIVQALDKDCELALNAILPVTQICAEIITNAVKHACAVEGSSTIHVTCRKTAAGTVVVEVRDSGPGLPDKALAPKAEGLGFRLVAALIEQVGGSIAYNSTPQGLTVRLELPAGQRVTAVRSHDDSPFARSVV